MKIFDNDGKINFVDDNNVFVGFDYEQTCSESFGYTFSDKKPSSYGEFKQIEESEIELESYEFDTYFFQTLQDGDCGGNATFRLTNGLYGDKQKEIFLTIFNTHNGYYSHGFEFVEGNYGKTLQSGKL
jgi:hypothetical protein